MYYVSPFTYVVDGLLGQGELHHTFTLTTR